MVSQQNVNKRQRASAFTPYTSLARVAQGIYDLAEVLANAGRSERALAWQAVSSFAARALVLVGQSESLVPVLNLAPVAGKPVFVTHPPFAAAEATRYHPQRNNWGGHGPHGYGFGKRRLGRDGGAQYRQASTRRKHS